MATDQGMGKGVQLETLTRQVLPSRLPCKGSPHPTTELALVPRGASTPEWDLEMRVGNGWHCSHYRYGAGQGGGQSRTALTACRAREGLGQALQLVGLGAGLKMAPQPPTGRAVQGRGGSRGLRAGLAPQPRAGAGRVQDR